jgi:hypothetical protein
MANGLYGVGWLPDPNRFNFVSAATRPVVYGVRTVTTHLAGTLGPLFTIVIGGCYRPVTTAGTRPPLCRQSTPPSQQ